AKTVYVNQQLDKKVNVADMRKPASDVAGTEEVNAKQDKIGYTPADDSKVFHSTVTQLNSTDMNTVLTAGFYRLVSGTNGMPNADMWTIYQVIPLASTNGVQLAYGTNNAILGMRSWSFSGNTFTSWVQFADDSKVVHSTDTSNWQKQAMFNPGDFKIDTTSPTTDFATLLRSKYNKSGIVYIRDNDDPSHASIVDAVVICEGISWWYAYGVAGNGNFVHRRIRATDDTGWVINADDYKVVHKSGANNFDTVPTVNNNPLLLASSLPSDLARTGQANTFNLAQTFSIAPTITDASKDKGDNQAATMADLKSVEDSAWHYIVTKDMGGKAQIALLYQKDVAGECIHVIFTADLEAGDYSDGYSIKLDMSSVVISFNDNFDPYASMSDEHSNKSSYTISGSGSIINFGTYKGAFESYEVVDFTSNLLGSGTSHDIKESTALGVSEFA
ncbi:pyocin knob domain-containing protein, partial [Lentilactobacillus diolivorans]